QRRKEWATPHRTAPRGRFRFPDPATWSAQRFQRGELLRRHGVQRPASDQATTPAHAPHPEEQHHQREKREDEKQRSDAQRLRDEPGLPEEERSRRHERREAHSPEMTREAPAALQRSESQHPNIARRS